MRYRVIVPAVVAVVAAGVLLTLWWGGEASRRSGTLPARTVEAGGVEVTIVPVRLDEGGAVFRLSFNTHSGDLAVDPAEAAALEVGGNDWGAGAWKGDPPGGHHREGQLTFSSAGAAAGGAKLTIDGLPALIVAEWTLPGD